MASSMGKCRCCKVHDDCCICLFDGGFSFSKSLKNLPEFVPETLPEWLNKASKDSSSKSWKFYKERYVHDVVVARNRCSSSDYYYVVRARCYHSMSKRQPAHFCTLSNCVNIYQTVKPTVSSLCTARVDFARLWHRLRWRSTHYRSRDNM